MRSGNRWHATSVERRTTCNPAATCSRGPVPLVLLVLIGMVTALVLPGCATCTECDEPPPAPDGVVRWQGTDLLDRPVSIGGGGAPHVVGYAGRDDAAVLMELLADLGFRLEQRGHGQAVVPVSGAAVSTFPAPVRPLVRRGLEAKLDEGRAAYRARFERAGEPVPEGGEDRVRVVADFDGELAEALGVEPAPDEPRIVVVAPDGTVLLRRKATGADTVDAVRQILEALDLP